ncbi:MAG: AAA family ATPase [Sediminibacterium sp.]|nr:AAA family ATPase [Sediminibacterium sp.]
MLISFKVSNYRSIGEEQELSLIPDSKKGDGEHNVIVKGKHKALNAVAIYGANASGKSNLLLAMSLLDYLIHFSAMAPSTMHLPFEPFMLREQWSEKPTSIEIVFVIDKVKYRYGFIYNKNSILEEWLFRKQIGREVNLFARKNDVIDVSQAFNGNSNLIDAAIEATRDNALFLSFCDVFNIEEAKLVMKWFALFNMIDGINTQRERVGTVKLFNEDEKIKSSISKYLASLDLSILNVDVSQLDNEPNALPDNLSSKVREKIIKSMHEKKSIEVRAKHRLYDKEGQKMDERFLLWDMERHESAGTNKIFHLSGPVLWTLEHGGVLILDEIEAKLHPVMTLDLINLFLNKDINKNDAQLIFATHDTNLLTYSTLRRDQIYFAEKNKWESTEIYSLSDFTYIEPGNNVTKRERPDTDKEKRYLEGRYGAIPVLSKF